MHAFVCWPRVIVGAPFQVSVVGGPLSAVLVHDAEAEMRASLAAGRRRREAGAEVGVQDDVRSESDASLTGCPGSVGICQFTTLADAAGPPIAMKWMT